MADPESTHKRRSPDTEMQVAAAAITAAISPPLGLAVAAGSALRSARVREALRRGTVQALAGAIQLGDQLTAAAARRAPPPSEATPASRPSPASEATPASEPSPNGEARVGKAKR